eukprot:TRINITY_DN49197_c0_g1_i1.p1 TRINITY_DN49197_c0_g1~~TRINITY_DN49197_c0_g1_i1.p1  ORF type:complete len:636 (+),score=101.10 TRINITY_DN49197_c0_g1_i1:103-1908(+)
MANSEDDELARGGGVARVAFGNEAERQGTRLDKATDQFLKEAKSCVALQIPPGQDQLTAMEFVAYLDINLQLEPELAWIAREMLAAPMPPNAKLRVSKSGVCYFHDVQNDYFTIEHPLTQRYLKVLERARLDLLAIRTKPSVNGLLFSQPDMLFHRQFRNLQIPCQSCGVMQSMKKCQQCLMSFCGACYDALHAKALGPRKNHTTLWTAYGSLCSTCAHKKPQVFCANCEEYFCFKCFEEMHRRGNRLAHKSMMVAASDGEIIESQKRDRLGKWNSNKCEECCDNMAAFACDYCLDNYCVQCFWKCHFNGHRRQHTASKMNVIPMCNQCTMVRATVFCEQCQELMCTECFTMVHAKGNRMLHLFMDAMDLLLLLERLDPTFQEHMRRARPRVLWAISSLQGWTKGIDARRNLQNGKDFVTQIQRRWRGTQTRRRMLGMLHMHKWRRRQVNNYFLPKTQDERSAVKQKCKSVLAAKEVGHRDAQATLKQLRSTIMQTSKADEHEIAADTRATLDENLNSATVQTLGEPVSSGPIPGQPTDSDRVFSKGPDPYTFREDASRISDEVTKAIAAGGSKEGANLTNRDPRKTREQPLRQITRTDDP